MYFIISIFNAFFIGSFNLAVVKNLLFAMNLVFSVFSGIDVT